jgi:hypothetical protein
MNTGNTSSTFGELIVDGTLIKGRRAGILGAATIDKRRAEADNGRDLPWQALGENVAVSGMSKTRRPMGGHLQLLCGEVREALAGSWSPG